MDHKVRAVLPAQTPSTNLSVSVVEVRNVHGERIDRKSSVTDLINSLRNIPRFAQQEGMTYHPYACGSDQLFFSERERLYGKDMYCPAEWRTWIKTSGILPDAVKPGATGDILPETVETLMSYLGVSDTCMHSFHGSVYRPLTHSSSYAVT